MTSPPPASSPAATTIRPCRGSDLAAVYDVCVRTGAAGGDARGLHSSDDLLPDVFAGPYVHLEPDLALVLDDGDRAVGYVVGTADTAAFVRAYRQVWIPRLADRYPVEPSPSSSSPSSPSSSSPSSPDEQVLALHRRPERMLVPELAAYPAHLHVDLLPAHQGGGHGRALLEAFLAAAARAGAPAVHVGMARENTRARGFYDRLGFAEIAVPDAGPVTYLGRSTT